MKPVPAATIALAAVATAAIAGARQGPTPNHPRTAAWYARLRKPSFTPPGPVFGAAWTALEAALVFTGYRLLRRPQRPARAAALGFWGLSVLGVGGFQWVLFGRKRLDEALGVTAGMAGTTIALAATATAADRPAGIAMLPLAAWTMFALALQEEVWRRNRNA